jgi:hypothetical protein
MKWTNNIFMEKIGTVKTLKKDNKTLILDLKTGKTNPLL